MNPQERAINLIEHFFKEANVDGNKSISCARIFVKKMQEFCGENTYYLVENERRFGIKLNAYWDRVNHFIKEIEKQSILDRTEELCKNTEAKKIIKVSNKKK